MTNPASAGCKRQRQQLAGAKVSLAGSSCLDLVEVPQKYSGKESKQRLEVDHTLTTTLSTSPQDTLLLTLCIKGNVARGFLGSLDKGYEF